MEWLSEVITKLPVNILSLIILILVIGLLVVVAWAALCQGREISLCPPKIGPKKEISVASRFPTVFLKGPDKFRKFNITLVEWNKQECFLQGDGLSVRVNLAPAGYGFKLELSEDVIDQIKADQKYKLMLRDIKGYQWKVNPFSFSQILQSITPVDIESKEKILNEYVGEDDET